MNNTTNASQPLVTVAMVTYNSEKYVRTAIESVLHSSYTNFELIISDDCSTDKTWEIINEYNDSRIRPIQNASNIGEYPNRNRCVDLAKGKYFLFLDGDDYIYPHGLQHYVNFALDFPFCNLIIQKAYYNNIIFPVLLSSKEVFIFEFFRKGLLSSSFSSNFFKTKTLADFKIREDLIAGDHELRYRIALKHKVLFIPGFVTWPRETPGQASSQITSYRGFQENFIVLEAFLKDLNCPFDNVQKKQIVKKYLVNNIKLAIKRKYIFHLAKLKWILKNFKSLRKYLFAKGKQKNDYLIYTSENPLYYKKNNYES